jgi:gamma-glutamylcyclotransferase (GGCT)/AIG2-like uncharacterized protein YtfP
MKVFVYGTLMRGLFNDMHLRPFVDFGSIDGDMYIVEIAENQFMYPAGIPGSGTIRGEVYGIEPETVKYLDFIEGYDDDYPQESLFIRKLVKVNLDSGNETEAYVYFFNKPIDGLKLIEHGDFRKFIESKV